MNCESFRTVLPISIDNALTENERAELDAHLSVCPLCRDRLTAYAAARAELRSAPRPAVSAALLQKVRSAVAEEIDNPPPAVRFAKAFGDWKKVYLVPYSIGTAASLVFSMVLLYALFNPAADPFQTAASYEKPGESSVLLAANSRPGPLGPDVLTPAGYARERLLVSAESPSVNPQGALIALTRSFIRGDMKDDEVVVVADVFGDGLARIAEVVEPSKDRRAVRELEKALRTNPEFAPPFVPAALDNRSDSVRVVLKFQTVEVDTKKDSK